jgi:Threonine dehydrogenase and related Zn-dependent dehydrogenases
MKALQFPRVNHTEVVNIERPSISGQEVLVKVGASGICHTDVEILRGNYGANFPVIPGHEFAGTVEKVGKEVDPGLVGRTVVVDPNVPCHQCAACAAGLFNKCSNLKTYGSTLDGGFSEYVAVDAGTVHSAEGLSMRAAALAEPLACVLHGLNRLSLSPQQRTIIFGTGPIGMLMLQALRAKGVTEVACVDRHKSRLEIARRLGAHACFQPDEIAQESHRREFNIAIDATGIPAVIQTLPDLIKDRGTILLFGVCPPDARVAFSPFEIYDRELAVLGSCSLCGEIDEALELLKKGAISVDEIVSHQVSLDQMPEYLSRVGDPDTLKVQLVFDKNDSP